MCRSPKTPEVRVNGAVFGGVLPHQPGQSLVGKAKCSMLFHRATRSKDRVIIKQSVLCQRLTIAVMLYLHQISTCHILAWLLVVCLFALAYLFLHVYLELARSITLLISSSIAIINFFTKMDHLFQVLPHNFFYIAPETLYSGNHCFQTSTTLYFISERNDMVHRCHRSSLPGKQVKYVIRVKVD